MFDDKKEKGLDETMEMDILAEESKEHENTPGIGFKPKKRGIIKKNMRNTALLNNPYTMAHSIDTGSKFR